MLLAASQGGRSFKAFRLESFSFCTPYQSRSNSTAVKENATALGAVMVASRCISIDVRISPYTKLKVSSVLLETQPKRYNRSFGTLFEWLKKNKG